MQGCSKALVGVRVSFTWIFRTRGSHPANTNNNSFLNILLAKLVFKRKKMFVKKCNTTNLGARRFGDIMGFSNNHSSFSPISSPCGGL